MALFRKLLGTVGKLAPVIPGVGGIIAKGAGVLSKVGAKLPKVVKTGAGVVGAGAGFEVGGRLVRGRSDQLIDPRTGRPFRKHRRAGLSGRDIMGAQKVARVVRAFGYKPKYAKRKGRK